MEMTKLKIYITLFLGLLVINSCKKVIDLKLGNVAGKLVIEGNITDIPSIQYIKLSRNVPFTNTNTYPAVTGATVTVTDNDSNKYAFREGPAGTYSARTFAAFYGNTFTMKVTVGDTTYTAHSTLPDVVHLDSLTSKDDDFNNSNNRKEITVHFQDTPEIPNQYRFLMYVNKVQVKAVFAFDDEFTDGRYVNFDLIESDIDIYPGDTVTVEMQCIDKPMYTYWFSLMQQQPDGPGGGVTPSNPPTNITPVTLGYFSAHTTQTLTMVVK